MTTVNKKVQTTDNEQNYWKSCVKNKTGKCLYAKENSLPEFYIGLTLAMYFRMPGGAAVAQSVEFSALDQRARVRG